MQNAECRMQNKNKRMSRRPRVLYLTARSFFMRSAFCILGNLVPIFRLAIAISIAISSAGHFERLNLYPELGSWRGILKYIFWFPIWSFIQFVRDAVQVI